MNGGARRGGLVTSFPDMRLNHHNDNSRPGTAVGQDHGHWLPAPAAGRPRCPSRSRRVPGGPGSLGGHQARTDRRTRSSPPAALLCHLAGAAQARERPFRPAGRAPPTHRAKTRLLAAVALLAWLDGQGIALADCGQAQLDGFLVEGPPSARAVRDFLDWAAQRRLVAALAVPGASHREGRAMDDEKRCSIVEGLLHDQDHCLSDRVAGCLILLYGQQLSRIVALTTDQVVVAEASVSSVWTPAAPSPQHPRPAPPSPRHSQLPGRRAALMHLAAQLPAAVLADLLHLHPTTAVHWVGRCRRRLVHLRRPGGSEPVIANRVESLALPFHPTKHSTWFEHRSLSV